MDVTITSEDVADTIAAHVSKVTELDCESYTNDAGSVVVCNHTAVIAWITPLYNNGVIDVTAVGGTFDGEPVYVPFEAETIGGLREIANFIDRATSRVICAAVHH